MAERVIGVIDADYSDGWRAGIVVRVCLGMLFIGII